MVVESGHVIDGEHDRPVPERQLRVLLNPNCGSKAGLATNRTGEDDVREMVERFSLGDELIITESEEHARELTRDAVSHGYAAVIAAGGDGTVRVIARELLGTTTALGILPLGSVMNIARILEIPRDLEPVAAIIAAANVRQIDVGDAGDVTFFESASVGVNAPVFAALQRFDAGEYRSILEAIWVAIRYRPARMVIHLDDRVIRTRALMVTMANGPYTGMGLTVAPDALLDDGRFDVSLFRRFSRVGLLWHLLRTAFGRRHYSPKVDTYRSVSVRLQSHSPLPARADSDDLGTTPIALSTIPGALRVIVPAAVDPVEG